MHVFEIPAGYVVIRNTYLCIRKRINILCILYEQPHESFLCSSYSSATRIHQESMCIFIHIHIHKYVRKCIRDSWWIRASGVYKSVMYMHKYIHRVLMNTCSWCIRSRPEEVMWLLFFYIYTHRYIECIIMHYFTTRSSSTGWQRLIGSPKLQIIFHKRATKHRSLLRKMTYKDKGSYESSPPCMSSHTTSWSSSLELDGYCSTVQGLLEWFEVDLGFTEIWFIQIDLCVLLVFGSLLPRLTLFLSIFWTSCTASPARWECL